MEIDWDSQDQASAPVNKFVRAGTHEFKIVSAEETNSRNGHPMLKLRLRAVSGPDAGLHVMEYLNVGHPNPSVQNMAKQKLRQLASAVGIERKFDTAELVGKQARATVYLDDSGEYINTRVRSFSKSEISTDLGDAAAPDCPF